MITIWQKILSTVFINFGTSIRKPLGEWNGPSHTTYGALTNGDKSIVYIPQGAVWMKYSCVGRKSRHKVQHGFIGQEDSIPTGLFPTTELKPRQFNNVVWIF